MAHTAEWYAQTLRSAQRANEHPNVRFRNSALLVGWVGRPDKWWWDVPNFVCETIVVLLTVVECAQLNVC